MVIKQPDNVQTPSGSFNRSLNLPYNPGPAAVTAEANYFQASFPLKFTLMGTKPDGSTASTPNNSVTPAGQEAEVQVFGRLYHAVQLSGTFNATIIVEGTLDGQNWTQIDSLTAPAIKQYTGAYYSIRVRISTYTSGAVQAVLITQR